MIAERSDVSLDIHGQGIVLVYQESKRTIAIRIHREEKQPESLRVLDVIVRRPRGGRSPECKAMAWRQKQRCQDAQAKSGLSHALQARPRARALSRLSITLSPLS